MRINEIPVELRPREKALRNGIENLSDQELLALIIGSGVAGHSALEISENLLKNNLYSLITLSSINLESLLEYKGLKTNNALKLLATFEFNKRINLNKNNITLSIRSAEEAFVRYKYMEDFEQEILKLVLLDSKYRLKKEKTLYKGTYDSFSINVNEIIKEVVISQCKKFILVHNHPDETSKPSSHDIVATKAIEKSAKNLGIEMVDHIIIFRGGYYSFKKYTKLF